MQSRMKHPVFIVPEAFQALQALGTATEHGGVPKSTRELIHFRASQINSCSACLDMHAKMMRKSGETGERLFALSAWRESPLFTAAERAALALTESVTRLSDKDDAVPDAVWEEAARHYDEVGLASLLLTISTINVWNRLNVATRQIP